MVRNADADRFVDCVVSRGKHDIVTGTLLIMVSMLVPAFFGATMSLMISEYYPDIFDPERDASVAAIISFSIECAILSFILLFMSRRSKRHMRRDVEWMSSLCGYVDSIGGDSAEMRRIAKSADMLVTKINNGTSMAIWAFTSLYVCAIGILSYNRADILDTHVLMFCFICYVLLLAQFLLTAGSTSKFPTKHDKLQCEFTHALCHELRDKGISIDPMKRSTGELHPLINTFLFIITLGVYAIVIIIISNIRFNRHIRNQWKYEEGLMAALIHAQGAAGIEGC